MAARRLLIDSSGHIVGAQPRPRAEGGRIRIILAVVGLVGIVVVALGSLSTSKALEGDHVVVAVAPLEEGARRQPRSSAVPMGSLGMELANSTRR